MEAATATLNKNLEKILDDLEYEERDVKIKPVSSGGANYTTTLFEVTVTCPTVTLELFAKVADINESVRKQMDHDWATTVFHQEMYVYQDLAIAFREIELKHKVPWEHRYLFPKFYGCNSTFGEETFVMENLTKVKFYIFSRFNILDWEHASASIRDLARFNALSMALEKEYPEVYEKIGSINLPSSYVFEKVLKSHLQKYKELVPEQYKSRIEKFAANDENVHKLFTTRSGKNVLIHGDYRTSNIMYRRQNGRLLTVPVDYQTVRLGNPFVDFHYFIAAVSDEKFRELYYNQLVDYYYSEMGLALKRLGLDIAQEYPRHLFDDDHKLFLPVALVIALTLLPTFLVPENEAPDIASETANISNLSNVRSNEIYRERLDGILRDFARWNVI